jgi:hypothetical protein
MLTDVSEMLLWHFAHFCRSRFVRCIDSNIYSTVSICWQFPLHIWDIPLLRITLKENVYPKNNTASDNTVNVGIDFGAWNSIVRYCKMFQLLQFLPQLVKCSRPTVFSKLYTICKSKSSEASLENFCNFSTSCSLWSGLVINRNIWSRFRIVLKCAIKCSYIETSCIWKSSLA